MARTGSNKRSATLLVVAMALLGACVSATAIRLIDGNAKGATRSLKQGPQAVDAQPNSTLEDYQRAYNSALQQCADQQLSSADCTDLVNGVVQDYTEVGMGIMTLNYDDAPAPSPETVEMMNELLGR